jgi:hypothetical protein
LWTSTNRFALGQSRPLRRSCIVRPSDQAAARNVTYFHARKPLCHFIISSAPCSSSKRSALACSGGPQTVADDVQGTLARKCVNPLQPNPCCWPRIRIYKLYAESCSSWVSG